MDLPEKDVPDANHLFNSKAYPDAVSATMHALQQADHCEESFTDNPSSKRLSPVSLEKVYVQALAQLTAHSISSIDTGPPRSRLSLVPAICNMTFCLVKKKKKMQDILTSQYM